MPNALDMFREQGAAVGEIHARLLEISALIGGLENQVKALTCIDELRALLAQEQTWLEKAQQTLVRSRSLPDQERRLRPGVVGRWALAMVFALASAAGARYAAFTRVRALRYVK